MALSVFEPSLQELARDELNRLVFKAACEEIITSGQPVSIVAEAIQGTRWRFMLTKSGQGIEVEHKDDLYSSYWAAIADLKKLRDCIGRDKYEDWVLTAVRNCRSADDRAMLFVTKDDNVGNLYRDIDKVFEGTGYCLGDRGIEPDDSDRDEDCEA